MAVHEYISVCSKKIPRWKHHTGSIPVARTPEREVNYNVFIITFLACLENQQAGQPAGVVQWLVYQPSKLRTWVRLPSPALTDYIAKLVKHLPQYFSPWEGKVKTCLPNMEA